jgi:GntR family transcriptional regulator/MocR family aminotransferase
MKISEEKISLLYSQYKAISDNMADTLYKSIYFMLKTSILNGDLPSNCELPSTRRVSEQMKVSRSTIIKAYDLLRMEGLVIGKGGSGFFVSSVKEESTGAKKSLLKSSYPELSLLSKAFEQNKQLLNTLEDDQISFRPGLPPLDIFPVNQWKQLTNKYWQIIKTSELTYHNPAGMDALRISLAQYLTLSRGIKCQRSQIFVVGGSLQSLFLIGSMVLNAGDKVALEEQSFPNVHSIFKGLRAKLIPSKLDSKGINLKGLKGKEYLKLIHVTPACQYPTGIQMSRERRMELLEVSKNQNAYIIENDYEHEINSSLNPLKPIFSLDDDDRTFYLGTFNRILHPSIRLGFMIVPKHLVTPMAILIRHSHMFLTPAIQLTLRNFIENQFFHGHINKLNKTLIKRKEIFENALKMLKSPLCTPEFLNIPSLHMLIHIHRDTPDQQIIERLKKKEIIVHALSKCAVGSEKLNGLIIGYASTREQKILPKLKILIQELNKL